MIPYMLPESRDAYRLFHQGSVVMADMSRTGFRIDRTKLEDTREALLARIAEIEQDLLREDPDIQKWQKKYGASFNINSDDQLRWFLFEHLKQQPSRKTKTKKAAVDGDTLRNLDFTFVQPMLEMSKLRTVVGTFIGQLLREADDQDIVHALYNLATIITFRSSSDSPNGQNFPSRDEEQGEPVKSAILTPFPGYCFGEADLAGAEVRVGHAYHQDPQMYTYLTDPSTDMHRDSACDCLILKPEQVTKNIRWLGKNKFVFPQFYGSCAENCARAIWNNIHWKKITMEDGSPLTEHMIDQGIGTYPKFLKHMEDVTDRFWHERFGVYTKWKEDWYSLYLRKGYFITKTGFRCTAPMSKNQCINYPIQGDAFHVLLQCAIWMWQEIREQQAASRLMGQIHDSMLQAVHPAEREWMAAMTRWTVRDRMTAEWSWLTVPMDVEIKMSAPGKSWWEAKKLEEAA